MSNGHLQIHGGTIVENQVHGKPRTDSLDRPNLAGGVAATIGNAHAVEYMLIGHSVISGNTVHEFDPAAGAGGARALPGVVYNQDIFTGSLLHFKSRGYNRLGIIDFSQILVPVGEPNWFTFSRRHFPKTGDEDEVAVADVLDLAGGVSRSDTILSVGVDAGQPAVLYYLPTGSALEQVPATSYRFDEINAAYNIPFGVRNDFLAILLDRLEGYYGLDDGFAENFTTDFEAFLSSVDLDADTDGLQPYTDPLGNSILTLGDTLWFGPAVTWPKVLSNHPYIHFWHRLDRALLDANVLEMGSEVLGDADWAALFPSGRLHEGEDPEIIMTVRRFATAGFPILEVDQMGTERPVNRRGNIGAIEAAPTLTLPQAQQTCVNEMNKNGEKVNKAQLKENERCLREFQAGRLVAPMTFDACTTADQKGRVQRAEERTATREAKKCDPLDVLPRFAYMGSATVNAAAVDGALTLMYEIFGGPPVLDDNLVTRAEDRETARCQLEMLKRAGMLENTVLKEVNRAKKKALRDETVDSGAALEAKLQAVFTSNDRITRTEGRLVRGVDRKCAALQAPPDTIFPGACGAGDPNLQQVEVCVIEAARREACVKINVFDDLNLDCDQVDD
jgi:hypothetical protein